MNDLRTLMLRALLLDWFGQVLILAVIMSTDAWYGIDLGVDRFKGQVPWLVFVLLLYPLLGWLFGSYTVLRWRRLTLPVLLQRLLITAAVTFMAVAMARWLINPSDAVWVVYRRVQLLWIGALSFWALGYSRGARGCCCPMLRRFCCWLSPKSWSL